MKIMKQGSTVRPQPSTSLSAPLLHPFNTCRPSAVSLWDADCGEPPFHIGYCTFSTRYMRLTVCIFS